MNKIILAILFSMLFNNKSIAQFNHRIIYRIGDFGKSADYILKNPSIQSRLVFNDTLSFYELLTGLNGGKSGTIGKKLIHHSIMYNANQKLHFEAVAYKGRFLISDDRSKTWKLLNEIKNILGYKCYAAISINDKNDTIKAWYAPDINRPYGPAKYNGLPGVVLEVQEQPYSHIIALKIDKTNHKLFFPKGRIVTRDEYFRKKVATKR
jgi:GLPGLI family protein